jgi:hypothetical protein
MMVDLEDVARENDAAQDLGDQQREAEGVSKRAGCEYRECL